MLKKGLQSVVVLTLVSGFRCLDCGADNLGAAKPLPPKREAVIKTFPDGYRDDGEGSVFSDATSVISFYLWHREKEAPFTIDNTRLTLDMPDALEVAGFGVYRTPFEESGAVASGPASDGKRVWTLNAGRIRVRAAHSLSGRWGFAWTTSNIQVYVRPEAGKRPPRKLEIVWQLEGDGLDTGSGTMRLATFPVQKAPPLQRFQVWSTIGMFGGSYGEATFADQLRVFHDIGVNGVMETAGSNLPPFANPEELGKQGFSMVKSFTIRRVLPLPPAKLEERYGVTLSEEDYAVNLNGERTTDPSKLTNYHTTCTNYYCLTRLQDPSSPVFNCLCGLYREYAEDGFRYFWSDYEHSAFEECYCPLCRKAFAESAGLPERECLELKPLDLIAKHTVPWYRFRTAQIGMVLQAASREVRKSIPDVRIGYQDNFHHEEYFMPEFDSYGFAHLAEDPRILDPYLDFHDSDTIGSALQTVYDADLYFQKDSKGESIVKKPLVARACGFIWLSWSPHVVFQRMEQGKSSDKFTGLGGDIRPLCQKLEIANLAAVGVSGVELDVSSSVCDARVIRGVSDALAYVAEFEDLIKRGNRLKWDIVEAFDCTDGRSPFHEIGPKGYSGKFTYLYIKKFGFIQFVSHKEGDRFLTSVFNWDLYQDKKLKVCFPGIEPGDHYVSLYLEGERIHCTNGDKETWTSEDLEKGVGVEIPAGGICAIQIGPTLRPGYAVKSPAKAFANAGKKQLLYTWRKPKSEDSAEVWKEQCYDRILKRLIERGRIKPPLNAVK